MSAAALFSREFTLAALANLTLGLGGFALYVHLPGHLRELGAREAEIGRVMATSSLAAIALLPWLGLLMDRRGLRGLLRIAGAGNALAMALYTAVDGIGPELYALRLLHGLCTGTLYAGLFTVAADCVPEAQRTRGLALFGTSGLIPIALGAWLGDLLLGLGSYPLIFAAAAGCAAVCGALCAAVGGRRERRSGWEPPRGISAPFRQADLVPVWCMSVSFFGAIALIFTFMKTYVLAAGHGSVSAFFAPYALVAIALRVVLGGLPDRFGPERMLGSALGIYALGLLALGASESALALPLAGLICGTGHAYAYPILYTLVVRRARSSERGTALALYAAIEELTFLVASPALGLVIERGGYPPTFCGTALALLAAGALFLAWERRPRPSAAA